MRKRDPMSMSNETWVVEIGGDVIEKRAKAGVSTLTPIEVIVYWLWWADYMMRNAGDFANAVVLEADFQHEIVSRAKSLGLKLAEEMFALSRDELQRQWPARFDATCNEIRVAYHASMRNPDKIDTW